MRTKDYERKTAESRGSGGISGGVKPPSFWRIVIMGVVLACLIIPGLVLGQVTPDPDGPIDYGPTIETDRAKLFACYSIIRQMIDEYNEMSMFAEADKAKYADKFRTYANITATYLKEVLAERNRLREKILWATYTPEEWGKIDIEDQHAICVELFGDKMIEKEKPTVASAPGLDSLRQIDLDSLEISPGVDPIEDFTTYTEVDPGSDITKDSNTISFTQVDTRNTDSYVYYDKGVDHFDGDFSHRFKLLVDYFSGDANGNVAILYVQTITNQIDDIYGLVQADYSLLGQWVYNNGGVYRFSLIEWDSGDSYTDYFEPFSLDIVYYWTFERDEGVGTYGTIYDYICTGNYYGESGSSLIDTLSVALHTSKKDFRYDFAVASYNTGLTNRYVTGWFEDLDLQEGEAEAVGYSFGYIIGG